MTLRATRSNSALILAAMTIVYFVCFFWLVGATSACKESPDLVDAEASMMEQWLNQHISCKGINELGDALAGAFAPIAFLWLAGAVFIQSQELSLQRQELHDTRIVMREQAAEARASTGFLKQQTNILERQQLISEQKFKDDVFETLSDTLKYLTSESGASFFNLYNIEILRTIGFDHSHVQQFSLQGVHGAGSNEERWSKYINIIDTSVIQLRLFEGKAIVLGGQNEEKVRLFFQTFCEMHELSTSLSDQMKVYIKRIGLAEAAQKSAALLELLDAFPVDHELMHTQTRRSEYSAKLQRLILSLQRWCDAGRLDYYILKEGNGFSVSVRRGGVGTSRAAAIPLSEAEVHGADDIEIDRLANVKFWTALKEIEEI